MQKKQLVEIDYTNWRNERATRVILPMRFDFISTEWHPADNGFVGHRIKKTPE